MNTTRLLRHVNSQKTLRILRDRRTMSRADIARELGVTRTTVGYAVRDLMDAGLVTETDKDGASMRGRPGTGITLDAAGRYFIGAEITSGHITALISDFSLSITHSVKESIDISGSSVNFVVDKLATLIDQLLSRSRIPKSKVHGVGVSLTGVVTPDGRTFLPTSAQWRNIRLADLLAVRLPKSWVVKCCNDAAAVALSLIESLPQREKESLLLLMLSDGVGSAMVRHGYVDRGATGLAGELGLTVLSAKLSENGRNFQQLAGYHHFKRFMTMAEDPELALQALANEAEPSLGFKAALDEWAETLASGILNSIYLLDPERILVTGPSAVLYTLVADQVEERLRAAFIPGLDVPKISMAEPDKSLPALGAAALVREDLFLLPNLSLKTAGDPVP